MVIIETSRLIIRALTREEAEAIVADDRVAKSWTPDYPTPGDIAVATLALAGGVAFATAAMPWGLFAIVEKASDRSIGGIGFKNTPNDHGEVEIGYGICRSSQGRGVATEAVAALCDFAHQRVRIVLAETDRENVASQRVLEKCGFQSTEASEQIIRWRHDSVENGI